MSRLIHITEAARMIGVSTQTLRRWEKTGRITSVRSAGGHRRFREIDVLREMGVDPTSKGANVAYCRVSSRAQRPDLVNQRGAVEAFAGARGLPDLQVIEEIGGGMNLKRPKFLRLMDRVEDGEINVLIVAHQDRLCRFGFEWFERFCERHGCELLVMNQRRLSPEAEMVEDLLAIVQTFSARLDGLRSYKWRLRAALSAPAVGEE